MRFKFTHQAALNERFAPAAFDARIGDPWPIELPDGRRVPAHLVAAEVAEDGRSVQCTIEIDDPDRVAEVKEALEWSP